MKKVITSIGCSILFILTSLGLLKILEILDLGCTWKRLFNITCVGCGFTRSIKSLFKLDIYQAFRYNPLLFILLIIGIIYGIVNIIYYIKNNKLIKIPESILISLAIILVVYMILRNIPGFEYLLPTEV